MGAFASIVVAGIGLIGAVTASFFTAQATADERVSNINTEVQVLAERQENQYREVKESLQRIEARLERALK